MARDAARRHAPSVQPTIPSRSDGQLGSLIGGTLVGAALVAVGLSLAILAIGTPLVSRLIPAAGTGASGLSPSMAGWVLAILAGASLLVSGTDRLAGIVAGARARARRVSPVARALASLPADVTVTTGVAGRDGRPVPHLAIGAFGVAVVHELPPASLVRRAGPSWEILTAHGWAPTEGPLERAARDADRVRYWLNQGDLDFVARVHAALVSPDPALPRTAGCAVIGADQIGDWIAALPRQRSLTEGRRQRLSALVQSGVAGEDARRGW